MPKLRPGFGGRFKASPNVWVLVYIKCASGQYPIWDAPVKRIHCYIFASSGWKSYNPFEVGKLQLWRPPNPIFLATAGFAYSRATERTICPRCLGKPSNCEANDANSVLAQVLQELIEARPCQRLTTASNNEKAQHRSGEKNRNCRFRNGHDF